MKPIKIAVTGSAGSGKSLVCLRFGEIGLVVLDCDQIARLVVEPGREGYDRVVQLFGPGVVRKGGGLDRAALRNIIINQPDMRKKMEAILHPIIRKEMIFQMETADYTDKDKVVAVEVPLLFESGMESDFDISIAVLADEDKLVQRICLRDGVTDKSARKMVGLQMSQDEKLQRADYVIYNKGGRSELFESVDKIYAQIQKEFLTI